MTDRRDPSQYPSAQDFRDLPPIDYPDGTTVAYPQQEVVYASDTDLVNELEPHQLPTPENRVPALTVTTEAVRYEVRYRGVGGGGPVVFGRGRFAGYALRETTGTAPAVVRLRDGIDPGGSLIVPITIPAGGSLDKYLTLDGVVKFANGLYVELVSGSVEGSVLIAVGTRG